MNAANPTGSAAILRGVAGAPGIRDHVLMNREGLLGKHSLQRSAAPLDRAPGLIEVQDVMMKAGEPPRMAMC